MIGIDEISEVTTAVWLNGLKVDARGLIYEHESEHFNDRCTSIAFSTCNEGAIELLQEAFLERIQLTVDTSVARHKVLLVSELICNGKFMRAILIVWPPSWLASAGDGACGMRIASNQARRALLFGT